MPRYTQPKKIWYYPVNFKIQAVELSLKDDVMSKDVVDLHTKNVSISARFAFSDLIQLKETVAKFFISGSGGPQIYEGKDMRTAHQHMNISDHEYMAAVDDVMSALTMSDIGDREKGEVLYIFYSLRPDVVRV